MPAPARNINNELTGQIINIVCEVWNVSRSDLVSRSRKRPLPWAREQLCEFLRLYAGHDSVSCAAIVHKSANNVVKLSARYNDTLRIYAPFRDNNDNIKQRIKALICKPEKK